MHENFPVQVFGNPIGCDDRDGLWGQHKEDGRWYKLNSLPCAVPEGFPILPNMIRAEVISHGVMGRCGLESVASSLIQKAQVWGEWRTFSASEARGLTERDLADMVELGFLIQRFADNQYLFTTGLVMEFYLRYPARTKELASA